MEPLKFSKKGQDLIKLYGTMAIEGFDRTDNTHVEVAYSDFQLRAYRDHIRPTLIKHKISTVLDYGCGGSNWALHGFDEKTGQSAIEFFNLNNAYRYEPARDLDERQNVDCVISFDVLEHIFISDVPSVLRNMFSYTSKLLVLNVACYSAAALLPNGENAHITVRPPAWWKGMLDSISVEYPNITIFLICSPGFKNSNAYPEWSANDWENSNTFVINN